MLGLVFRDVRRLPRVGGREPGSGWPGQQSGTKAERRGMKHLVLELSAGPGGAGETGEAVGGGAWRRAEGRAEVGLGPRQAGQT